MAKYEILEEIAELNRREDSSLCLDRVQFEGGEVAYDLRVWHFRPFGEKDPGRGLILRPRDLRALYEALLRYYKGKRQKVERPEDLMAGVRKPEYPELVNDTPL